VLGYSVGESAVFTERGFADFQPARELAAALAAVRDEVGAGGYIILAGFSAGGHLAAGYCLAHSLFAENAADSADSADVADNDAAGLQASAAAAGVLPMPDALLLSYPMLRLGAGYDVGDVTREAFDIPASIRKYGLPDRARNLPIHIWHSATDDMIPYESSPAFVKLLGDAGARVHFTRFETGRHGDPSTTPGWFEAAMEYLDPREVKDQSL
jgi:acetyl esterase/lipase